VFVGNRQSDAGAERRRAPRRHPWTCSIVAIPPETGKLEWDFRRRRTTTARLGCGGMVPVLVDARSTACSGRCCCRRHASGYFFRASIARTDTSLRSVSVCHGELGQKDRQGRPADHPNPRRSRRATAARRAERGRRHELSHRPASNPARGLFIVSAQDSYGFYFFKPGAWRVRLGGRRVTACTDRRCCCEQSIIGPGAVRWAHDLGEGGSPAGRTDHGVRTRLSAATRREMSSPCGRLMAPRCGIRRRSSARRATLHITYPARWPPVCRGAGRRRDCSGSCSLRAVYPADGVGEPRRGLILKRWSTEQQGNSCTSNKSLIVERDPSVLALVPSGDRA